MDTGTAAANDTDFDQSPGRAAVRSALRDIFGPVLGQCFDLDELIDAVAVEQRAKRKASRAKLQVVPKCKEFVDLFEGALLSGDWHG